MASRIRYFPTENSNKLVSKPIIIANRSYVVNLDTTNTSFQIVDYDNGAIVHEGTDKNMTKIKLSVKKLLTNMGKNFSSEIRVSAKAKAIITSMNEEYKKEYTKVSSGD